MKFNPEQLSFLAKQYVARISTATRESIPHVSPVYFIANPESISIATDKTTTKYRDLDANPIASVLEQGDRYQRLHNAFLEKYPDFKATPGKLGTPPIISVNAEKIWDHRFS